jgi:Domain of Unknown Function (DUF748)
MLQFLKTKKFRITAGIVVLLVLYAIAGFVIAPKLVRSALLEDIPKSISATPSVGDIHINPFLFQATIDDFSLSGAGGEKLLGFKRLFIDFQLSSIWHRAYTFANIDITSPFVGAVVAQDGSMNLLQLRPKPAAPQPAQKSESLPALRIGSFKVSQGLLSYEDRSRPDVFAARLEPLNFELRDFATGVKGGQFTFTGASKLGERVEWHGHLSVDPTESDGEFQVNGLLAKTLWEYLQDRVNFVVDSGAIDLTATYKFSLKDAAPASGTATPGGAPGLHMNISTVALTDLVVRPKGAEAEPAAPWITLPALDLTGTSVDLATRQVHVDLLSLKGLKLVSWLEPDGTVNLMKLAAPVPSSATPAPTTPPTTGKSAAPPVAPTLASGAAAPSPPWAVDLRRFEIRDADISVEDRSTRPAVKVVLAPFSLQVDGASQDLSKPVSVTLETHIDGKGSLSASGDVTPQPTRANLTVKLADIDLTAIQPYIARQTAMTLLSGRLGVDGKLHYGAQPQMPAVQFNGNINVEKVHTVDDALHDDFINWDRLDILGVNYSQGPDRLDIDQVVARKLYARVIIESDESMNVKRVLKMPAAAPADSVQAAAASDPSAAPPVARSRGSKRGTPQTAGAAPAPATQTMPMSIKKVVVNSGQANFTDLSVKPNFSAGIQNLEGTVVGLSSKPGTRAKVDLKGSVDTFSPVSITGAVNVLGPLYTDLTMSFRNISLPVFDPYSGKFAGYNIAKGKLTTELHYKVDGRKLDAQHHIVIEQLEFGDKTPSKEAVSLPVKLAVSLLKDRNGVIDLTIPVTGSLDDPQFRLAPIIWKVFVNILEKAVTAPFALLGALFGGGPDIQFIDFKPGVGTLDPAAADKVKTVAKALIERPQLKIDVPIAAVPDVDGPALVDARFAAELSAAQSAKGSPKKAASGADPPPYDQLDPATQLELLTQLYSKDIGAEPKFPDAVTSLKSKPDMVSAKLDFLRKAIHDHIEVGGELQSLGQQRAAAVQAALLTDSQVTADRVFVVANDKATTKDGVVRLELSLK